jgi:hypothetical protein
MYSLCFFDFLRQVHWCVPPFPPSQFSSFFLSLFLSRLPVFFCFGLFVHPPLSCGGVAAAGSVTLSPSPTTLAQGASIVFAGGSVGAYLCFKSGSVAQTATCGAAGTNASITTAGSGAAQQCGAVDSFTLTWTDVDETNVAYIHCTALGDTASSSANQVFTGLV